MHFFTAPHSENESLVAALSSVSGSLHPQPRLVFLAPDCLFELSTGSTMSSIVAIAEYPDGKRSRDIQTDEAFAVTSAAFATPVSSDDESEPALKRRRVSGFMPDVPISSGVVVSSTANKPKNPQRKYNPDTPMNKEELAAWRREQRRVRNRASAALSRQRQRDTIAALEIEVGQWKSKVDDVMQRIKQLEEASGIDSEALVPVMAPDIADLDLAGLAADVAAANTSFSSKFVSPPVSPGPQDISPSSIISTVDAVVDQVLGGVFEQEHSDKMISRHAVS